MTIPRATLDSRASHACFKLFLSMRQITFLPTPVRSIRISLHPALLYSITPQRHHFIPRSSLSSLPSTLLNHFSNPLVYSKLLSFVDSLLFSIILLSCQSISTYLLLFFIIPSFPQTLLPRLPRSFPSHLSFLSLSTTSLFPLLRGKKQTGHNDAKIQ